MADVLHLQTTDVAELQQVWTQFTPTAHLRAPAPESASLRWRSTTIPGLSLIQYSLTADARAHLQPEDQLFACRVVSDSAQVRSRKTLVPSGTPWATDGAAVEAEWRGTIDVAAMIFDRTEAQDLARVITGDDSLALRLTSFTPRTEGMAQQWSRAFDYMMNSLLTSQDDPFVEENIARHALLTTLATFASTYADAISRDPRSSGAQTVQRAITFIDENAHRPITVDDVAEAVHISTRGLQYAFRRSLETTPTEYLRRVRLDGAHRELRNPASDATVATIARRWGFGNPSRFSALYRDTYGRLPRQTLDHG